MSTKPPLHSVKKFYFLEYFHVLLISVEKYSDKEQVFNSFKILKQAHRLGESKYRTLKAESEKLSKVQLSRYRFTFDQVIDEATEFNLINEDNKGNLHLSEEGRRLLRQYDAEGIMLFNQSLFKCMETKYRQAFRYLINLFYSANQSKPGLLILPIYSPRELQFERANVKTGADIIEYSESLIRRLQQDIAKYLGEKRDIKEENKKLLAKLTRDRLLPSKRSAEFPQDKYNVITKRFRDFWINYFLREIYKYEFSLSSFDIWTYRGKQIGIIHATELYPNFNGRIVYPTSVIAKSPESRDFEKLYDYTDGYGLYVHKPEIADEKNQEKFVDFLVKAYFDIRRSDRSYFINLLALRELVCYSMKISEQLFEEYLNEIYKLNLMGTLRIRISLEVDKLPEETNAMYLKQEPVKVEGKYRNIIAIDVSKGKVKT